MKNILTIFAVVLGVFLFGYVVFVSPVHAGIDDNVSGYAWSETIGWISFNCTNDHDETTPGVQTCIDMGGQDYGVHVRDDDYLEGYAWAETIGWVSFNYVDTGAPPGQYDYSGQGFLAQLQEGNNQLRGWARALAGMDDPSDGWDGWIKLYGQGSDPDFGVTYNQDTGEFEGWAWGSDVIGWISFNCNNEGTCGTSNYAVRGDLNSSPTVSNLQFALGDYCSSPSQHFSWVFSDLEDGLTQGGYWLQVQLSSQSFPGSDSCPQCVFDSGKLFPNGSQSRFVNVSVSPGTNELAFNTEYRWRVQVYDSEDLESGWVEGTIFRTPLHQYPDLSTRFTWSPFFPSAGEEITFTDNVVFAGSPSWSWTFEDGSPGTSSAQNPVIEFLSDENKNVTLVATDTDLASDPNSGSGSCQDSQTVNLRLPLPEFEEIGFSTFFIKIWELALGFLARFFA